MAPFTGVNQLIYYFCPKESIGVEIGIHHAETTTYLLKNNTKICQIYAIDPYFDREDNYKIVKEKLLPYNNCVFIRNTSHKARFIVPDNLDFVFIDGDHSYEAVLRDLYDWVPKIRSGGILIGHDWTSNKGGAGVVRAGGEYIIENNHLFKPLFSNEDMKKMKLPYKIGGAGYIHKEINRTYPLWWRIKK